MVCRVVAVWSFRDEFKRVNKVCRPTTRPTKCMNFIRNFITVDDLCGILICGKGLT